MTKLSRVVPFLLSWPLAAQTPPPTANDDATLRRELVLRHATSSHELYRRCEQGAEQLRAAIDQLLATPDATTLQAARDAWCAARLVYGETEALRFQAGPIEPVEPLLNAWPVDEAYIDHVVGRPQSGIVHDTTHYRILSATLLEHANERGGETNVSVGWHAIEFLLWGQDLDARGPGARPATDFVLGNEPGAERRSNYLRITAELLVAHLRTVRTAWAPDAEYRRTFVADVDGAVRKMLTGAAVLSAFELCGERLAVAYETKDQEQEHSCFSDTTWADLQANQRGIVALLCGDDTTAAATAAAPSLLTLIRRRDADVAAHLHRSLTITTQALHAIPQPFDQAFLGADDSKGRVAIRAAIEALEQQAEAIAIAGRLLGHELPMRPGR